MEEIREFLIKSVLSGQIDEKIQNLQQRYEKPTPKHIYQASYCYKGADPTGSTATRLADHKLRHKDKLDYYKSIKRLILDYLEDCEPYRINTIKRYFSIIDEPCRDYYLADKLLDEIDFYIEQSL